MEVRGRKFLVTGGTGFIGRALVRALIDRGAYVRCFDDDSRGAVEKLGDIVNHVGIVIGDIRDAAAVHRAVRDMDCVCHLAYVNGTEFFYEKPDVILEVAVKGMMNVLDACVHHGVREFVLASSSEVYQEATRIPTPEEVPLVVPDVMNPRYSYGGGKIVSELLAVSYGRKHFNRVVIFRPHNVYGPDMGREHVIPQFVLRVKERAERHSEGVIDFPIQGTGDETRTFIYIDDFTRALLRVMGEGDPLGIYHIGTDREVSIRDLAHIVARACRREIRIVPGPLLAGSTPRRCPDIGKLRRLGFEPAMSLEEGVRRTSEWYLVNCDVRRSLREDRPISTLI